MVAAQAQAAQLGRPDLLPVYVRHPIQDQTAEAIRERADACVGEIVKSLTAGGARTVGRLSES